MGEEGWKEGPAGMPGSELGPKGPQSRPPDIVGGGAPCESSQRRWREGREDSLDERADVRIVIRDTSGPRRSRTSMRSSRGPDYEGNETKRS
jgi:hypothetical protein